MATATINLTPPVEPEVESITLVLSVAEAQAIRDVFGSLAPEPLRYLAGRAVGKGSTVRLAALAGTYKDGNAIGSIWAALHRCTALKDYTEV